MSVQPRFTGNTFQQLLLIVLSAKTKPDKIYGRQTSGTFRRKRPFAIQRVVGINSFSPFVSSHTDAASQMTDNQVQIFVFLAYPSCKATSDGSLV